MIPFKCCEKLRAHIGNFSKHERQRRTKWLKNEKKRFICKRVVEFNFATVNKWAKQVKISLRPNGATVFCFLSSLPHKPPATTEVFGSYLSSVYGECGHAYPYERRDFVGPKKKTSVGLLAINSSMLRPGALTFLNSMCIVQCTVCNL